MQLRSLRCHGQRLLPLVAIMLAPAGLLTAQGRGGGAAAVPPVSAMETMGKLGPIVKDGILQPVTEFSDTATWIRQRVWVETNFDTDLMARWIGFTPMWFVPERQRKPA